MSEPPKELRDLWARRDRMALQTALEEETVLLAYKHGDEPKDNRQAPAKTQPDTVTLVPENTPVRELELFPTHKVGVKPINLATYHAKGKRE